MVDPETGEVSYAPPTATETTKMTTGRLSRLAAGPSYVQTRRLARFFALIPRRSFVPTPPRPLRRRRQDEDDEDDDFQSARDGFLFTTDDDDIVEDARDFTFDDFLASKQ